MHSSTNVRTANVGSLARAALGARIGEWQLERCVGEGQWTHVYQARALSGGQHADYALKVLKPEYGSDRGAVGLLQREAAVGRELAHPHLISILAAHTDRPPFYLVTPYLPGSSLRTIVQRIGRLETPIALWTARQTAEALQAMHERGWLHCDIKPENISVAPNGFVTVCDLGFARRWDRRPSSETSLTGTPAYLPPETYCRSVAWTPACDIYSLGVMLYELLTGELPFPQSEPESLASAILTQPAPDPRQRAPLVPVRVSRLLRHLLAKNPLRRPDAVELINWLVDLEIDTFDERLAAS